MDTLCDYCDKGRATVYCASDTARLCLSCDRIVHSANNLSLRHERTLLCDGCNNQPAVVRCRDENLSLCIACDNSIHCADLSVLTHWRHSFESFTGCPSASELAKLWGCDLGQAPPPLLRVQHPNSSRSTSAASLPTSHSDVRASNQSASTIRSLPLPTSGAQREEGFNATAKQNARTNGAEPNPVVPNQWESTFNSAHQDPSSGPYIGASMLSSDSLLHAGGSSNHVEEHSRLKSLRGTEEHFGTTHGVGECKDPFDPRFASSTYPRPPASYNQSMAASHVLGSHHEDRLLAQYQSFPNHVPLYNLHQGSFRQDPTSLPGQALMNHHPGYSLGHSSKSSVGPTDGMVGQDDSTFQLAQMEQQLLHQHLRQVQAQQQQQQQLVQMQQQFNFQRMEEQVAHRMQQQEHQENFLLLQQQQMMMARQQARRMDM